MVLGSRGLSAGDVHVEGDRISGDAVEAGATIDATDCIVAPGFIDLQINGGFGLDLRSDPEAMWQLARQLPQHGVTAFLPTIVSAPRDRIAAAQSALQRRPADAPGALPLGLHLEGPMLNERRAGAHDPSWLVEASLEVIDGWSFDAGVALVTLAPELDGALEVIGSLRGRGVVVSAGHSDATADEAAAGFDAGVSMVTHLFNAMRPFGHRNPNLVGVTLTRDDIVAGLIADGVHVDPLAVAAAWRAKGPDGVALVTDAVAPTATDTASENVRTPDGVLAGSLLPMDEAVRNLHEFTGCTVTEALRAASATPARVLGDPHRGSLSPGSVADVVVLDPELRVLVTICAGDVAYVADSAVNRFHS